VAKAYERTAQAPVGEELDALADGLIEVHFDLTPRGRRALA
jgi:hypothetical protein